MKTELHPCKRCGGERFEVTVEKHHELLIGDEPGRAEIFGGGDSVGDVTCSTCGRVAITPDQLTQAEKDFLLDGKEVAA